MEELEREYFLIVFLLLLPVLLGDLLLDRDRLWRGDSDGFLTSTFIETSSDVDFIYNLWIVVAI